MLDPRLFRQDPDAIARALSLRGVGIGPRHLIVNLKRLATISQTEMETLQHERNVASKEIGEGSKGRRGHRNRWSERLET